MPKSRKSTSLKIAAIALGVAGLVGLTVSSAASLNLTGGTIGAGSTVVAACQASADTIGVSYVNAYSATAPGYTITSVKLSNVDAACAGQNVKIDLTGASNVSLGEVTGTAATGTNTFTLTTPISATSVVGTAVAIYN